MFILLTNNKVYFSVRFKWILYIWISQKTILLHKLVRSQYLDVGTNLARHINANMTTEQLEISPFCFFQFTDCQSCNVQYHYPKISNPSICLTTLNLMPTLYFKSTKIDILLVIDTFIKIQKLWCIFFKLAFCNV